MLKRLRKWGFPVYKKGCNYAGSQKLQGGRRDLDIPVTCAGVVKSSGDYVFGDSDGVLVVPERHRPGFESGYA
ncbi:MAG: hypothetical protein ACLSFC_15380 [Enterocloster bolteae]